MATFAQNSGNFSRSYSSALRLAPTSGQRLGWFLLLSVVLVFPLVGTAEYMDIVTRTAIAAMGALGMNILTGYAGLLSLGHAALLGVSGFVSGIVATELDLPFFLVIVCSMFSGAAVGLIVGLPAVRLRGLYLVISTFAFHFVALLGLSQYQSYKAGIAFTGLLLPEPKIGPISITSLTEWYYLAMAILAVILIYTVNILRTRPGRAWIGLKDRELVASTLGINVVYYKMLAFVVSSVITAVSGSLLVYYNGVAAAETYTITLAVLYLVMVIVGGLGSTSGAMLGAAFVTIFPRLITTFFEAAGASNAAQVKYILPAQLVVYGGMIAIFLIFIPEGLIGLWTRVRTYFALWPLRNRPTAIRSR